MSTRDKRFSKIGRDSRFIQLESRTSRKENVDGDARFANLGKSIADMAMETKSSKTHSTEEMQSDHSSDEHAEPIEEEYPLNSDDLEDEVIPYVDGEESTSLAIVNMDWDHIKLPICMSCSIPFCQRQESWSMSGCLCLSSDVRDWPRKQSKARDWMLMSIRSEKRYLLNTGGTWTAGGRV